MSGVHKGKKTRDLKNPSCLIEKDAAKKGEPARLRGVGPPPKGPKAEAPRHRIDLRR